MLKLTKITNRIYKITSPRLSEIISYIIRILEFYEHPEFGNREFTLTEFKRWYKKKYGHFKYTSNWAGFNINSSTINNFKKIFTKFYKAELDFFELLTNINEKDYNIILFKEGNIDAERHELSHAIWEDCKEFRDSIAKEIRKLDETFKADMVKIFKNFGYIQEQYIDELQAFITHERFFLKTKYNFVIDAELEKKFRNIFNNYITKYLPKKFQYLKYP